MIRQQSLPLVLGCAQLGMPYGIANRTGQLTQPEVDAIVKEAFKEGIVEFDTAQGYGQSEVVLGQAFKNLNLTPQVEIITKLQIPNDKIDETQILHSVEQSLERLGIKQFKSVLLHQENLLDQWEGGLKKILNTCVQKGLTQTVGVSVYSPHRAMTALTLEGIDVIQVPANALDQRLNKLSFFDQASNKKKDVYVRSVFLQGLLLMDSTRLSKQMLFSTEVLGQFHQLSKKFSLTPQALALGYVKLKFQGMKVILGLESIDQLNENIQLWQQDYPKEIVVEAEGLFQQVSEDILNPTRWPKKE